MLPIYILVLVLRSPPRENIPKQYSHVDCQQRERRACVCVCDRIARIIWFPRALRETQTPIPRNACSAHANMVRELMCVRLAALSGEFPQSSRMHHTHTRCIKRTPSWSRCHCVRHVSQNPGTRRSPQPPPFSLCAAPSLARSLCSNAALAAAAAPPHSRSLTTAAAAGVVGVCVCV